MTRGLLVLMVGLVMIAAAPFNPQVAARIDERPGAFVPLDVALRDEQGAPTTLASLGRGRPLLLVPVLHDCPNLCEVTLDGLAVAMDRTSLVADRDVAIVAFGIDSREGARDALLSLDRLALRHPHWAGHIHATVGEAAAVTRITAALGYHFAIDPRSGQVAHAAAVAVVTGDGHLSRWLYGLVPEPAALTSAVAQARNGTRMGWGQQLLLLCYHYDPLTGRYSLAIDWLLRAGALLTVAALLLFIMLARRRDRTS